MDATLKDRAAATAGTQAKIKSIEAIAVKLPMVKPMKMAGVLIKALEEANDVIRKDPAKAAAIYLKVEPSKLLDEAKVTAMLKAMPDDFGVALHGVKTLADFMGRTGGLKNIPAKWQDVVVPELASSASN